MELSETILKSEYKFRGKIISVRVDDVKLPDGTTSFREIVEHSGGVCALPIDDDGFVYFVRQFRAPYQAETLEIPAGKRDKDEDVCLGASRELKEEIGAKAKEMISLGQIYPSPGYCGEIIHIFLAKGLDFSEQKLDEGEFLNVVKMPYAQALKMAELGEIKDAKTLVALLKAKRFL